MTILICAMRVMMKKAKAPKTASTPLPGTIARYYYNLGISDNRSLQNIIWELLDNNYSTKRITELTGINDDEINIIASVSDKMTPTHDS